MTSHGQNFARIPVGDGLGLPKAQHGVQEGPGEVGRAGEGEVPKQLSGGEPRSGSRLCWVACDLTPLPANICIYIYIYIHTYIYIYKYVCTHMYVSRKMCLKQLAQQEQKTQVVDNPGLRCASWFGAMFLLVGFESVAF